MKKYFVTLIIASALTVSRAAQGKLRYDLIENAFIASVARLKCL